MVLISLEPLSVNRGDIQSEVPSKFLKFFLVYSVIVRSCGSLNDPCSPFISLRSWLILGVVFFPTTYLYCIGLKKGLEGHILIELLFHVFIKRSIPLKLFSFLELPFSFFLSYGVLNLFVPNSVSHSLLSLFNIIFSYVKQIWISY